MSDYGKGWSERVESSWRTAPPPDEIVQRALRTECPDCAANVFVEEDETIDGKFEVVVAHDETCPWLREHESPA